MNKENLNNKLASVEESYSALQLGKVLPETDGYRAIEDAIKIGEMKVDCFFMKLGHSYMSEAMIFDKARSEETLIANQKEKMRRNNENCPEYLDVFEKVCGWVEKGFWKDGKTNGEKVRFLKKEIKKEKESSKRINL